MAWYTSEENRVNQVTLPQAARAEIVSGLEAVTKNLALAMERLLLSQNRSCVVALDGFKGAHFTDFTSRISDHLTARGVTVTLLHIDEAFQAREDIDHLVESSECPEDPSFGRVFSGAMEDLLDDKALDRLTEPYADPAEREDKHEVVIFFGMGAALAGTKVSLDRIIYLDVTREQLLIRSEHGEVTMLGGGRQEGFPWKRIYYVEYPLLNRHKKEVLQRMDWYVDNSSAEEAVLVPAEAYHALIQKLSAMPLALKVFYMPGPFGGSEFGERFKVRGLPNTSWDYEVSVGDNHLLVNCGSRRPLEMPLYNLIWEEPLRVLGPWSATNYPDHFPIAIYMQDGYFPPGSGADFKRTHMPHHLHPETAYCQRHFNEPLGRYEAYYIVRADPGAVTMHGFRDDADIDAYIEEVKKSVETKEEFDWRPYIYEHPSATGELHQLPPGTVHGTGGRQVILEIDTNPSRESTEYSFYLYDYCRPNFNYKTQDLTGPPLKLTLDHSLAQLQRDRRQDFMAPHCRPVPVTVREGKGWREVSFPMCAEMPYQVNRLEFTHRMEDRTDNQFQCLTLTAGTQVKIASQADPENHLLLEDCDTVIVPACFGAYVCENLTEGTCEIVKTFLRTESEPG